MAAQRLLCLARLAAAQLPGCDSEAAVPGGGPGGGGQETATVSSIGESPLGHPSVLEHPAEQRPRDDLELALANQVNQARKRAVHCGNREFRAVPPLQPSTELASAARGHARQMARRGFFQHLDPEGRGSRERAEASGFRALVAENLAWGQATAEQVVEAWLLSPGHCATLMSPGHELLGIGYAEGARRKPLWVMMVGQATPGSSAP